MKKQILVVGPVPPPYYGAAVVNQTLLSSKITDEFHLSVLNTIDHRGVGNMGRLDLTNVWLALSQIIQLCIRLATSPVDAVYLHVNDNAWAYIRDVAFILVARAFRRPIIGHFHNGNFGGFVESASPLIRHLIRKTLPMLSVAVVLGRRIEAQLRSIIPTIPICVVPNGINPIPFQNLQRDRCSEDSFTVLYVGHLFEAKGYMDVLRAAPIVVARRPDIRFILVGGWGNDEEHRRANEFVSINRLENKILFPGILTGSAKLRTLAQADVLVLPSAAEGHPLVILEAMAAGIPVIATDKGAIAETVINGETGFILTEPSPIELALKILILAENGVIGPDFGRRGQERLLNFYTEDTFVRNMAQVFSNVTA